MGPLLSIKTIPFQYELKITDAKLSTESPAPSVNISRQINGLRLQTTPSRLSIDTIDARASMGQVGVGRAVQQQGERGLSGIKEATGQFAREGDTLMDSRNTNAVGDIMKTRSMKTSSIDSIIAFLPSVPAKMSYTPSELSMQYERDKLSFDWRVSSKPESTFSPASIEFMVKEYARLEIEYLGGPIYVPKSSDPNYVPLDARG